MVTKLTIHLRLFILLAITCLAGVNSASIPSLPQEEIAIPALQIPRSTKVAEEECKFGQFLSKATLSCDNCDTYCQKGEASRDCPEECYPYLREIAMNLTIAEQEAEIQKLQDINKAKENTIAEKEKQIQAQEKTITGLEIAIAVVAIIIIVFVIVIAFICCTRRHQKITGYESTTTITEAETNQYPNNNLQHFEEGIHATEVKAPVQVDEAGGNNTTDDEVPEENVDVNNGPPADDGC